VGVAIGWYGAIPWLTLPTARAYFSAFGESGPARAGGGSACSGMADPEPPPLTRAERIFVGVCLGVMVAASGIVIGLLITLPLR
jgi:hypothetical protein